MDEIELQFNASVLAFRRADFQTAERILTQLKRTGDGAVRNRARLYLTTVYIFQYLPRVWTEENMKFLERAEAESREVLANNPSQEYRKYAEGNLDAVKILR